MFPHQMKAFISVTSLELDNHQRAGWLSKVSVSVGYMIVSVIVDLVKGQICNYYVCCLCNSKLYVLKIKNVLMLFFQNPIKRLPLSIVTPRVSSPCFYCRPCCYWCLDLCPAGNPKTQRTKLKEAPPEVTVHCCTVFN